MAQAAQEEEEEDSLLALLAEDGDLGGSGGAPSTYRELPAKDVWDASSLVRAWSAAMSEYQMYASSSSSGNGAVVPLLDREQQLIASPLWYAPTVHIQPTRSGKRMREDEEEEEEQDDDYYYDDEAGDDAQEDEEVEEEQSTPVLPSLVNAQEQEQEPQPEPVLRSQPFIHPSRRQADRQRYPRRGGGGGAVDEGMPYFNPSEWVPVSTRSSSSSMTTGSNRKTAAKVVLPATAGDIVATTTAPALPAPPPVEQALAQDPALLELQTPQDALEKALQAWYTAGYAAALYHIRSGIVKP